MISKQIHNSIKEASGIIGKTWPLYAFVTSNPLTGYENESFKDALLKAKTFLNTNMFPDVMHYKSALSNQDIDYALLVSLLNEHNFEHTPEYYLQLMGSQQNQERDPNQVTLDRIMVKWLSAFLDEGLAEWEMPGKDKGFYKAWRALAVYDQTLGINRISSIPETSLEALEQVCKAIPDANYTEVFSKHIGALPGWTGYINYRLESDSDWQKTYPITMQDYLAVRLWVAQHLGMPIEIQEETVLEYSKVIDLNYVWLKAWEMTWQKQMLSSITNNLTNASTDQLENEQPDAQMVFCIDTRSEAMRRHVEAQGNYETFGYAGFFGITMDYQNLDTKIVRKSCPPIVDSSYTAVEVPKNHKMDAYHAYESRSRKQQFWEYFLKRMKNMLPSTFGFVEGSGILYGLSLVGRTLIPSQLYSLSKRYKKSHEDITEPNLHAKCNESTIDIPLEEKVGIVKSAFDLMGWKNFAKCVLFVGHGSHTVNNPFASSLDCGACAASPGRHNARMLARLANLKEVRQILALEHRITIPEDTIFLGAEHNTTTDEIVLFDSDVPKSHEVLLNTIKLDLQKAQKSATLDRLGINNKNSVAYAERMANSWSETRPEWGLAKNAGFIIGERSLTKASDLESRCFLHSYNWKQDNTGEALEGIMQGPMVVTQWINNHYYFSSVDNSVFGSGSKITQNVVGKFGVVQGNGGDLKMGLPLQSLSKSDNEIYHQPLRLSVLIHAPISNVTSILSRNKNLKSLLDNEWIYLMVMDPLENNTIKKYEFDLKWSPFTGHKTNSEAIKKLDHKAEKKSAMLVK